jgi:ribosomal biogenesis protein LAS1
MLPHMKICPASTFYVREPDRYRELLRLKRPKSSHSLLKKSMTWLLHNYYLPTLNPIQELAPAPPPRPLLPILECYKDTMKTITRDVSLLPRHRPNLITVLRDLERWIAECKVAANVAVGELGFGSVCGIGDVDFKEAWALESFCDGLATKGMLVPLSKKSEPVCDVL